MYRNDTFDIEMFYEPKIYPYSKSSSTGDLVDTSNTKPHEVYGKHHYCPDFIIKIRSKNWNKTCHYSFRFKNIRTRLTLGSMILMF